MRRSERLGGSDRRGRSAAQVLTLVFSAVLVLAGCAEPVSDAAAPPTTAAPVRTSGPLADGFEIEPGSGLIGAVFPLSADEGRQAVLRVDGDGRHVFDGYARQAEELGFRLESGVCCRPEREWCTDADDEIGDEPDGPWPVGCTVYGRGPDDLFLSLWAFLGPDGHGWVHLRLTRHRDAEAPFPTFPELPDGPAAPATDVEVAPDLTPEMETRVRIVEGSTLISEPIPSECLTGGYVAVLQVTGDLLPVMRGYGAEFDTAGFGPDRVVGDEDEPRIDAGTAGGGILSAVGVAGDPSHVLLERCND